MQHLALSHSPARPPPKPQVRALCRRQFFARAMGLKVAEVQQQAPQQVTPQGYSLPYTIAHGDTWSGHIYAAPGTKRAPPPPFH